MSRTVRRYLDRKCPQASLQELAMSPSPYADLLALALSPEKLLRQALRQLEADLRELALLALADWDRLGIVAPELFRPVAQLQRPSWGHWNGLLSALREVRKNILRTGDT